MENAIEPYGTSNKTGLHFTPFACLEKEYLFNKILQTWFQYKKCKFIEWSPYILPQWGSYF